MIEPTIGRVIHLMMPDTHDGVHAGIITYVWNPHTINVFDCNDIMVRTSVLLLEEPPPIHDAPYAVWMPYQKGQAAKTEEVTAALGRLGDTVPVQALPGMNIGTPPAFKGTLNEAVVGLKGPHISADMVNSNIKGVTYFVTPGGLTTMCEITLQCGFTIRGQASVMKKENFKLEIGKALAYQDAWKQIWPLMAYALASRLYTETMSGL